jgi:hypothetical protein
MSGFDMGQGRKCSGKQMNKNQVFSFDVVGTAHPP